MPRGPCGALVRSNRLAAYSRYRRICSSVAESVGMTTKPCDTRAFSGCGWLARNASMFSPWMVAKSRDSVPSVLTTELVR